MPGGQTAARDGHPRPSLGHPVAGLLPLSLSRRDGSFSRLQIVPWLRDQSARLSLAGERPSATMILAMPPRDALPHRGGGRTPARRTRGVHRLGPQRRRGGTPLRPSSPPQRDPGGDRPSRLGRAHGGPDFSRRSDRGCEGSHRARVALARVPPRRDVPALDGSLVRWLDGRPVRPAALASAPGRCSASCDSIRSWRRRSSPGSSGWRAASDSRCFAHASTGTSAPACWAVMLYALSPAFHCGMDVGWKAAGRARARDPSLGAPRRRSCRDRGGRRARGRVPGAPRWGGLVLAQGEAGAAGDPSDRRVPSRAGLADPRDTRRPRTFRAPGFWSAFRRRRARRLLPLSDDARGAVPERRWSGEPVEDSASMHRASRRRPMHSTGTWEEETTSGSRSRFSPRSGSSDRRFDRKEEGRGIGPIPIAILVVLPWVIAATWVQESRPRAARRAARRGRRRASRTPAVALPVPAKGDPPAGVLLVLVDLAPISLLTTYHLRRSGARAELREARGPTRERALSRAARLSNECRSRASRPTPLDRPVASVGGPSVLETPRAFVHTAAMIDTVASALSRHKRTSIAV